ncbi:Kiwa anti-phage protein KwaB-like domain-containing protein [Methylobacterium sp. WL103]|uniref:Kiwa anti-phage protein KwaB-like domain-containing protein n=1 Tax=Methylobacterium sp. WL103 TaxID=2603891 RepID=UPI001650A95B|nr:Kiwa anti-phage protein KwaB-like domain-containing protein [Methylobacterium sp. WL103]
MIDHANNVDYYFVIFHDSHKRKSIGLRRAAQLKATLKARNRLMQLIDDTMILIEHPVFRLDNSFDGLVCENNIYFANFLGMEYIANITDKVAKAAKQKIPIISEKVSFLDFSGFVDDIEKHPRTARLLVAISNRQNLDKYDQAEILRQAAAQGVGFTNEGEPRLKCRVVDKHKLLEVLDDRRWISRNATDAAIPYRASSRQKTKQ